MSNVSDMNISTPKRIGRKRNERERRRVQGINDLLNVLKDRLPSDWTTPKMSKLEILRKSTSYIKLLMEMSTDEETEILIDENLDGKQAETKGEDVCGFKDEAFSGSSQSSACSVGIVHASTGEVSIASSDTFILTDSLESDSVIPGNCFPVTSDSMPMAIPNFSLEESLVPSLFTCKYQPISFTHQRVPVMETSNTDLADVTSWSSNQFLTT